MIDPEFSTQTELGKNVRCHFACHRKMACGIRAASRWRRSNSNREG